MITRVYKAECGEVEKGDVVFTTFKSGTNFEPSDFQHAALYISNDSIRIENLEQTIDIVEVVHRPSNSTWPDTNEDYHIDLIGKVVKEEFGEEQRNNIRLIANDIIDATKNILKGYNGEKKCSWDIRKYKYVFVSPHNSNVIEELHFTCSGFVEYCYERAGWDIINDNPQCFEYHKNLDQLECSGSPLPLTKFQMEAKPALLIHRLFPGYLIHAFEKNEYPLNVCTHSSESSLRCYQHREQTNA